MFIAHASAAMTAARRGRMRRRWTARLPNRLPVKGWQTTESQDQLGLIAESPSAELRPATDDGKDDPW